MPEPLLDCVDVRKSYAIRRGGRAFTVTALDGVSVAIGRGETLGLVGESGSGKSSLGRIVAGLNDPSSGEVSFGGRPLGALDRRERRALRRRVQVVWQDPLASMNTLDTVETIVTEAPISHGIFTRAERRERAVRILDSVGMPADVAGKRPTQLSGGQLQRIAIGRAIALEPELLICDEVTSALDVSVQAQILNLLHEVQQRTSVAYLFISHDLHVVRHISDRVAVMHAGRVVEIGASEALYRAPQHPYTRELVRIAASELSSPAADAELPAGADLPRQGCLYRFACPLREAICFDQRPPLTARPTGTAAACHVTARQPAPVAA